MRQVRRCFVAREAAVKCPAADIRKAKPQYTPEHPQDESSREHVQLV